MKQAIGRHNSQVLKDQQGDETHQPGCNCTGRCGPCPLQGGCLVDNVVYKATIVDQDSKVNTYTGLTSNTFKQRFYGHRSTIENKDHENPTTLSTHVWDLKERNKNFEISWSIIDRAKNFNPATRKCNLCIKEKYYIIFHHQGATLNERSELYSTCRHRLKQTLANT